MPYGQTGGHGARHSGAGLRLLGIDIGGTRSRAILWAGGQVLAERQASSASLPAAGLHGAQAALAALLAGLDSRQAEPFDAICVGSAGLSVPGTRQFLQDRLTPLTRSGTVVIVSDVMLVLPAAGLDSGVAVICGTGSVAVGSLAGRTVQLGGWGYLLGDEGGGYWIVREALRQLLQRRDQGRPLGELADQLLRATGCADLASLHRRYLQHPHVPGEWAQYAGPVLDSQDPAATGIAQRAAAAIAGLASATIGALDPPADVQGRIPVVLAGGLLGNAAFRRACHAAIAEAQPRADVSVLTDPPVAGAVRLAGLAAARAGSPGPPVPSDF